MNVPQNQAENLDRTSNMEKIVHRSSGMRSQSAIQRDQTEQPPIFINHGDINININVKPEDIEKNELQSFIMKNI